MKRAPRVREACPRLAEADGPQRGGAAASPGCSLGFGRGSRTRICVQLSAQQLVEGVDQRALAVEVEAQMSPSELGKSRRAGSAVRGAARPPTPTL